MEHYHRQIQSILDNPYESARIARNLHQKVMGLDMDAAVMKVLTSSFFLPA